MNILKETENTSYTNIKKLKKKLQMQKKPLSNISGQQLMLLENQLKKPQLQ